MLHPTLTRRIDSMSAEIGQGAHHSYRCIPQTVAQFGGPLEMEIGFRSDRQAAMYRMLQLRRLIRTLLSRESHPTAASAARFTARLTLGIHGPRCCL
jgi:hypothetical protein